MTFWFEDDGIRPELRFGSAGSIRVVPKLNGTPVDASALSSATYVASDKDGNQIASGTVVVTSATLGDRTVGYYVVTIPVTSEVLEYCTLLVEWTHATGTFTEIVEFDIVTAPLGEMVTMSDLIQVRPDIEDSLIRVGARLGFPVSTDAQKQAAAEAATRAATQLARADLQSRLIDRAARDERPRPYQIIDRRAVAAAEVKLALMHFYAGFAQDPEEGEDSASTLYRHYRAEAYRMLETLRIRYTVDDDLVADEVASYGQVGFMERHQA